MNDATIFLLMIPAAAVCYALYLSPWWVRQLWPRVRYLFSPEDRVGAKLLELQAKHALHLRDGGWIDAYDEDVFHTHYAVFKAADGRQYTMVISKGQYQGMLQGTTGILTHKGNRFVSFTPEK